MGGNYWAGGGAARRRGCRAVATHAGQACASLPVPSTGSLAVAHLDVAHEEGRGAGAQLAKRCARHRRHGAARVFTAPFGSCRANRPPSL